MKDLRFVLPLAVALSACAASSNPATLPASAANEPAVEPGVSSRVEQTRAGELILIQEVVAPVGVARLWASHATSEGWMAWAAPLADVDLRVGGKIRTNYNAGGTLGDDTTNTVTVVSYAPERVLVLQADLTESWPEFLKAEADRLYNVIVFERISDNRSRLVSYGLGYADDEQHRDLMKFFVKANERLYAKLLASFENDAGATNAR